VFEAAEKVLKDVGRRVTVLVNNAGIVSAKPLLQLKPVEVENTFKVNVLSHFYTIQAFLPYMIGEKTLAGAQGEKPRGHIVSIASVAGEIPALGLSDYCATKAGALSLMDTLELELYEMNLGDRIHLTSVMPFFMDTKLFAGCKPEYKWLFPIVPAPVCANRVVEAVRKNDREVYVTGRYCMLPLLKRFLPASTVRGLYTMAGAQRFASQLLEEREASAAREAAAEAKSK
jgi:all-trans-retinol dehydrogenase (NAD+)